MFNFTLSNIGVETEKPQLGEQQVEALDAMKEFLKDKNKRAFSLIGAAGTGKSFLMRTLIEYMDSEFTMEYTLCAPTHKAKLVLSRFTNRKCYNTASICYNFLQNIENFFEFGLLKEF